MKFIHLFAKSFESLILDAQEFRAHFYMIIQITFCTKQFTGIVYSEQQKTATIFEILISCEILIEEIAAKLIEVGRYL